MMDAKYEMRVYKYFENEFYMWLEGLIFNMQLKRSNSAVYNVSQRLK